MVLNVREQGEASAPVVVILHGLLGSSRNWTTLSRKLAEHYRVLVLDLRNHGQSPWSDAVGLADMADDIAETLASHSVQAADIIGHSLGGKVAIRLALQHPQVVQNLVVVDISPRQYPPYHARDFEAMMALPLQQLTSRREADLALAEAIPALGHRQFLLTNLQRDDKGFHWSVNLAALYRGMGALRAAAVSDEAVLSLPTLFVAGDASSFIQPDDHANIRQHFTNVTITTVPDAGHNVHADNPKAFLEAVLAFIAPQRTTGAADT